MREYIGIPYRHGGRSRDGIDCYGLVKLMYSELLNVELPEPLPYLDKVVSQGTSSKLFLVQFQERDKGVFEFLDVIMFKILGWPSHCGVYVEPGWMIHSHRGCDSVMERYDGVKWQDRHYGTYYCSHAPATARLPHQIAGAGRSA